MPGRRRLVHFIFQCDIIGKDGSCMKHLSLVSVKAKQVLCTHPLTHIHTLIRRLLLKKYHQPRSSFGGVKQLQRQRGRKTLQSLIQQLEMKNYCNLSFAIAATLLALSFEVLSEALAHG